MDALSTAGSDYEKLSGEQVRLQHGDHQVVVVGVGGALREYTFQGRPVLDGYGEDAMCTGARGQILVPWPNRIKDGEYQFDGQKLQLALTEPQKHTAIHGLVRWTNFVVVEHELDRAKMGHVLHAQRGWPFVLAVEIDYQLSDRGLTVRTTATNVGPRACPFAAGAHPYLTLGEATIDGALLKIPARTYLPTDEQGIPTGRKPVDGTPYDFRAARRLGSTKMDFTFTDLERDADGLARVILRSPDGARAVTLWLDQHFPFVEIFTGDTLEQKDKRRTGLGVEPMTCAPNAFQSGDGLIVLQPGESFSGSWGIEPR